jgi:ABC-2 type transport system ATP-binding protein
VINAENLAVRTAGRDVLRAVTAQIPPSSTTVLLGASGSGRSALLHATLGILSRSGGTLSVFDLDPGDGRAAREIRSRCGFVPQNKSLYGNFTVQEMCRFSSRMFPDWQKHLESRLLDRFELRPHSLIRELSPSRRTLLSSTLALSHSPELLLFDEPFDDLDPGAAQNLLQAIVEASGDGATIVIATNNPERVEGVADQVMYFQDGALVISTLVDDIKRNWRRITAHFAENAMLPSLPVSGVEYIRNEGKMIEWVVSKNASEIVTVIQSLGAVSVQVDTLTMFSLFSRFPK